LVELWKLRQPESRPSGIVHFRSSHSRLDERIV
jgi:hypothetical protein